jgi:hypothetical protein
LQLRQINISTIQIAAISRPDGIVCFNRESADLVRYVEGKGGRESLFIENVGGVPQIVAVFTQMPGEAADFEKFGENVQFDGTHPQLLY